MTQKQFNSEKKEKEERKRRKKKEKIKRKLIKIAIGTWNTSEMNNFTNNILRPFGVKYRKLYLVNLSWR